jgi:hypothetical protein
MSELGRLGLVLALAPALACVAAAADVRELGWLQGRWIGEKGGVSTEEWWTDAAGGALLGLHRDIRDGRLVAWEFLRIDSTAEGVFYFASPRSAPPTAFKLVESGSARAVFENKQHDFPQRILYWLDAVGTLHARIEGPQAGRLASEEWAFSRDSRVCPEQ